MWPSSKGFWRNVTLGWVWWCHQQVWSINQNQLIKLTGIKPASLAEAALAGSPWWHKIHLEWNDSTAKYSEHLGVSEGFETIILACKMNKGDISSVILLQFLLLVNVAQSVRDRNRYDLALLLWIVTIMWLAAIVLVNLTYPKVFFLLGITLLQADSHCTALKQCCISTPPLWHVKSQEISFSKGLRWGQGEIILFSIQ